MDIPKKFNFQQTFAIAIIGYYKKIILVFQICGKKVESTLYKDALIGKCINEIAAHIRNR
jgi:hypothetical protein